MNLSLSFRFKQLASTKIVLGSELGYKRELQRKHLLIAEYSIAPEIYNAYIKYEPAVDNRYMAKRSIMEPTGLDAMGAVILI